MLCEDKTKQNRSLFLVFAIFFLYKFSDSLLQPTIRIYIYQQVCISQGYSEVVCTERSEKHKWGNHVKHTDLTTEEENLVQKEASKYLLAYRILLHVPTIFLCFLTGSWSNIVGRKLPMLLPPLGAVCATILLFVSQTKNVSSLPCIMGAAAVFGIFGRSTVMSMATSSYVVDLTSEADRTEILGRMLSMNFLGVCLGSLVTGLLLNFSNMTAVFVTVIVLDLLLELAIAFLVKESVDLSERPASCIQIISPCVNIESKRLTMMDSISTLCKKRATQKTLIFLFVSLCINQVLKQGEQDVFLLLVERSPFKWPGEWYSYYLSASYLSMALSLLAILPAVNYFFNPRDSTLVMFGLIMKIVRLIITSLAQTSWLMFFSAVIGCFGSFITLATKSMISKIIDNDEIGQTFSLLSCAEALSNLIGPLIFNTTYSASVDIFPGLIFVLDAVVELILLGCFFKLYFTEKHTMHNSDNELTPIVNSEHHSKLSTTTTQNKVEHEYNSEKQE